MVEGAPLLREYTGNGIEGSNPFVSAITHHSGLAATRCFSKESIDTLKTTPILRSILLYKSLYILLYID